MMRTRGEKIFSVFNTIILSLIALACLIPVWHVICCSVSEPTLLNANRGTVLWPLGQWTFLGYEKVFKTSYILRGYLNTVYYVLLGTAIGLVLTCLAAYGLSRKDLMLKKPINFFITFTMLFNGGLVPTYMVIRDLKMLNTVWAIVLPLCVSVFNVMIMRTSFDNIPDALTEAAQIDGAGHVRILVQIILPVSKSILAVVTLFYIVQHWNSWFHSALYIKDRDLYPLQLWLREIVIAETNSVIEADAADAGLINQTKALIKYCVIVIAILPMMIAYPFVQKYFVTGVMIGSVKG